MADLQSYNETEVDWKAIQSLAVRAAKETPLKPAPAIGYVNENQQFIDVCGPHWLLDSRADNWDEVRDGLGEEGRSENLYILMSEGQLMKVNIQKILTYRRESNWFHRETSHSVNPMREEDIVSFDVAKSNYGRDSSYGRIWGDEFRLENIGSLLQASKGAGLSLILESIRTGRAQQSDGSIIPSGEAADLGVQHLPALTQFHYTPDKRAKAIADLRSAGEKAAAEQAAATRAKQEKDRKRDTHEAFTAARRRALIALGVWLVLCLMIRGNESMGHPFAEGSYSITTWTLVAMVVGGLLIDLFVARGRTGAFLAGAVLGFAVNTYFTFSKPDIAHQPKDVSMFWLTALFGLAAYFVSARASRSRKTAASGAQAS